MNYNDKIREHIIELENFGKNGIIPKAANQNLKHFFENRAIRLRKFNLIEYLTFDKEKINIHKLNLPILGEYAKYNSMKYSSAIDTTKIYLHNKSKIYRKRGYINHYFEVADIESNSNQIKSIDNCPNCGYPSQIELLENDGCPYCHTKFMSTDLFPNISNYYIYDSGMHSVKNNKRDIKIIFMFSVIFGILSSILFILISESNVFARIFYAFVDFFFSFIIL